MRYLLDTNVISELFKNSPDRIVVEWFSRVDPEAIFLSVLSLGEVRKGVERMGPGGRKNSLRQFLDREVMERFEDRLLPVDVQIADSWGYLEAKASRTLPTVDALLAATALTHNLTLVTRNTKDFDFPNLKLVNPWD